MLEGSTAPNQRCRPAWTARTDGPGPESPVPIGLRVCRRFARHWRENRRSTRVPAAKPPEPARAGRAVSGKALSQGPRWSLLNPDRHPGAAEDHEVRVAIPVDVEQREVPRPVDVPRLRVHVVRVVEVGDVVGGYVVERIVARESVTLADPETGERLLLFLE